MGLLLYPSINTHEVWRNLTFETPAPCLGLVQKLLEKQHGGKAAGEAQNSRKVFPRYGLSGEEGCPAVRRHRWAQRERRGSRGPHRRGSRHSSTSLGVTAQTPLLFEAKATHLLGSSNSQIQHLLVRILFLFL